MLVELRTRIASFIAPEMMRHHVDAEQRIQSEVNKRVAEATLRIDPFERLMREFHGIFSERYERPEDKFNSASKLQFFMWAYSQASDPSFKYLTEWIMNTHANALLHAKIGTDREIVKENIVARAQLATMLLLRREIGRLSLKYEEIMEKQKTGNFNEDLTVE